MRIYSYTTSVYISDNVLCYIKRALIIHARLTVLCMVPSYDMASGRTLLILKTANHAAVLWSMYIRTIPSKGLRPPHSLPLLWLVSSHKTSVPVHSRCVELNQH